MNEALTFNLWNLPSKLYFTFLLIISGKISLKVLHKKIVRIVKKWKQKELECTRNIYYTSNFNYNDGVIFKIICPLAQTSFSFFLSFFLFIYYVLY